AKNRAPAAALGHVAPFRRDMPLRLPDAAGGKPHVHAGFLLGDRKVALRDLACPAAVLDPLMGYVEGRPELRKVADIRRRWALGLRELAGESGILRPRIAQPEFGVHRPLRRCVGISKGSRMGSGGRRDAAAGSAECKNLAPR